MSIVTNSPTTVLQAIRFGAGTLANRLRHSLRHPYNSNIAVPSELSAVAANLRARGYHVVPNYYSRAQCQELCAEIDRIRGDQPDIVQGDSFGADQRIYGAERASTMIATFTRDAFPHSAGEAYHRRELMAFTTLAGRIEAAPGNIGSGQGWHRDAFHFQYKSLIYLTDVDADHGPFQLLEGSHRVVSVFKDTIIGRLPKAPYSRLTEEQVGRLAALEPHRLKTFHAPAGTMILFDSSTIHRGAPIKTGVRYALTNYYYEPKQISYMVPHFAPYARPRTYPNR